MRSGRTIVPGLNRPPGSKASLTSSNARTNCGPNIASWNSLRTMPSPCSPEWEPRYSRTISKHSSAMARMRRAPASALRSMIGRTCRVPTEACAYQVPRVPWRAKMASRRRVYSARSSSRTAQSSTNETGFPSPFIDIMMLRPALRTSHTARWNAGSTASTTAPG